MPIPRVMKLREPRFLTSGLLVLLLMTAVACDGAVSQSTHEPTVPPTVPTTTNTPTPTSSPTLAPTPDLATETPLKHPWALLSGLPANSVQFIFVEADAVIRRPALKEEVESGIKILESRTSGVLDAALLASAQIRGTAFGITTEYSGAAILLGDFEEFPEVLRQAPLIADTDSRFQGPGTLDPHRGVELFVFPWYDDLFIAVPDSGTLLLAQSAVLLREIIDRRLDGAEVDESLASLLGHTGPIDFLVAQRLEPEAAGQGGATAPFPVFYAHAGSLEEGECSTVYAYMEFAEPAQAEQAKTRLAEHPDLSDLFFGYTKDTGKPVGEVWQEGRAVVARAVVPDKDVPDLFSQN